jgi:hypothetical protein
MAKKKKTAKKENTVTLYRTVQGTLTPFQIHAPWVVRNIKRQKGTTTIGLKVGKSKFDIDFDAQTTTHFLRKKAEVPWTQRGSPANRIDLQPLAAGDPDLNQNMILKATIQLGGQDFELKLGSDYSGATLKIQLQSVVNQEMGGGGTGTAGRGG